MNLLIIFFPLLGFFISIIFGRFLGSRGVSFITILFLGFSFFLSFINFFEIVFLQHIQLIKFFSWIDSGLLKITWVFLFDPLTSIMLLIVTFISSLVHIYSVGYMSEDPHLIRFLAYLSLFTFFMLMLVTAGNFFQLFLGWEGVGLASYLLINFWYTRIQANKAAIKAIIVNKFGDFALLIVMLILWDIFKTLDYAVIFSSIHLISNESLNFLGYQINKVTLIAFLLFVGAVGKSAQLGLHTWLPDAMEGPTPVSALIHAATMVTAGVFLLVRCSVIFENSPKILVVIMVVGGLTSFFAGIIGLVQNDLKKVIAYSTCSQLGYMIFACGTSNYSLAMFHLSNHAFFKALLFLGAGSVIHALHNEQDMRRMGGLRYSLPLTYVFILIGSFALMGFPFLTGFYSKDIILETVSSIYTISGNFVFFLGILAAFFTAFYSIRLIYLTFLKLPSQSSFIFIKQSHESNFFIVFPLICLAFTSLFVGYFTKDVFIGFGTNFWHNSIFINPNNLHMIDSEFIPVKIKLIPFIFTLLGIISSFFIYNKYFLFLDIFKKEKKYREFYSFLSKKWYFDQIYNNFLVTSLFYFGYNIGLKCIDQGFIQIFGARGLISFFKYFSSRIVFIQSGFIYHYIFIMFFGFFILLTFLLFYPI